MTADQLIQNARDTALRLYPEDAAQRAQYEAEMLRRYLREVVSVERKAAWEAVNQHIVTGDVGGNGWDKTAERNGLILAANVLAQRIK